MLVTASGGAAAAQELDCAAADSRQLAHAAAEGMRLMYAPGFQLIKAGVILVDRQSGSGLQGELDLEPKEVTREKRDRYRLMAAMDAINGRFGKGTLHVVSTGATQVQRTWGMSQGRRTPQYTTRWEDVPVARAGATFKPTENPFITRCSCAQMQVQLGLVTDLD